MATIGGSKVEVGALGVLNNLNPAPNSQLPWAISIGEFKRDYDFVWSVHYPNFSDKILTDKDKEKFKLASKKWVDKVNKEESASGKIKTATKGAKKLLKKAKKYENSFFNNYFKKFVGVSQFGWTYISRMAKEVKLPDLELEEETVDVGIYQQPIPLQVKYGGFSVTYLDDMFETVWNAHKNWLEFCGSGLIPLDLCCLEADYWVTTGAVLAIIEQLFPILKPIIETLLSGDLYLGTASSHYAKIYPVKLSRSDASKEGNGLATVTVEYKQLFTPKLQGLDPSTMVPEPYAENSYTYQLAKLLNLEPENLTPTYGAKVDEIPPDKFIKNVDVPAENNDGDLSGTDASQANPAE